MNNTITAINAQQNNYQTAASKKSAILGKAKTQGRGDILDIGHNGSVSQGQAMRVVLERSMERLRAVVSDARAELGIPENAVLDTSPEATANRIADFALGAFDRWNANHEGLVDDEAREQFAGFIGGAIQQGIQEARGILTALSSLTPEVNTNIDTTWEIIQGRLNDFVQNGQ